MPTPQDPALQHPAQHPAQHPDPALAEERAAALLALHRAPEVLVLANVWDVVSAQVVAAVEGVGALATASHAIAATFGHPDGEDIPLDLHLDMVGRIVRAVDLPVSMDMEGGYGDPVATAQRAWDLGVVGGNLEDQGRPFEEAVARVRAVVQALPRFVLNARTDVLLGQVEDRPAALEEAVRRGRAFLEAGAPVVFVPGVVAREEVRALVEGLGRGALSLVSVPGASLSTAELQELGVTRVSTGPFTQRVALTALQDAAAAVVSGGTLPPGTRALS